MSRRTGSAESILARLRNEAAASKTPFNQVLQFYAIERFLYRLSQSPHAGGVLLKGALLLRTVGLPRARPTLDIDLLRRGASDPASLISIVHECARLDGASDGVVFDPASIVAEDIAKDAAYPGTRVKMDGKLGNVRLRVQVDFGVGDAVVPGPRLIEYPAYLDRAPVALQAYPVECAVAEKFQAMVELDLGNSRMKDFYDVWMCGRHLEFDGGTLCRAIRATFESRTTPVPESPPTAFTAEYFDSASRKLQWRAFVTRIGEASLSDQFEEVVTDIDQFLMPAAIAAAGRGRYSKRWSAGGPWVG